MGLGSDQNFLEEAIEEIKKQRWAGSKGGSAGVSTTRTQQYENGEPKYLGLEGASI